LPEWVFERDTAELTVYRSPLEPAQRTAPLVAQMGALGEAVRVDAKPELRLDDLMDYRFEPEGITYLAYPIPKLRLEKRIWQEPDKLLASYRLVNGDLAAHEVWLRSVHELCPDYAAALGQGRSAFSYYLHEDRWPAVRNNLTGTAIVVVPSLPDLPADCVVDMLALQVELPFYVRLEPAAQWEFQIELRRVGAA